MFKPLLNYHTRLERQLEKVSGEPVEALDFQIIRRIHRADQCPAPLLPWLAWERSVDYWDDNWSEVTKRAVTEASIAVHRKKGTINAVHQALTVAGLEATVDISRMRPDYVPHTFRVQLSTEQNAPTSANAQIIRYQVNHVKPARCAYSLTFTEAGLLEQPVMVVNALMLCKQQSVWDYHRHHEPAVAMRDRHAIAFNLMREAA